jgi:predicted P-loop ATPase
MNRISPQAAVLGPPDPAFAHLPKRQLGKGLEEYLEEYLEEVANDNAGEPLEPPVRPLPKGAAVAAKFLEKLRPGGPWILIAILPDGQTTPIVITARTADEVGAFIRKHNGKANLYYSVNPTRKAMNKKAEKTDIAAIELIPIDLDPADGETSEAAKARYLAQINSDGFEPRPTAMIDSGNGLNGLARLKPRIELGEPVNGKFSAEDQAKIADVEARAATMMRRLGAKTGTQNIDRILRLPGTVNLPTAKKRREGRTECQSKLLWFDDTSYPLDAFPKEEPKEKPSSEVNKIDWDKVKQPGWLNSAADLPDDIPPKTRRIVEHIGSLKELNDDLIKEGQLSNPYGSWSEVTLALAASLKYYGKYTLEQIAEVLLADLPCNRHITEQKNKHRAVERAIARSYDSKAVVTAGVRFRDSDRYGRPKPSLANAVLAIRALGIGVSHDLFHHRITVTYNGDAKTITEGLLTDDTINAVRSLINNIYRFDCDKYTLAAIREVGRDNAFDPVLDMLDDCQAQWDGTKRLDTWVIVYLGCEDTPLNRAIGRLWLIAACRRARRATGIKGIKFDQIIVLEGEEGTDKSTAIFILAGEENFSDQSILGVSDKEVQEQLDGIWMHENADLAGMTRAEVERVKAFASRQTDRARPAWGRVREDRPRRSIETGTTNNDTYLLSQTGNRRFWPLKTGQIDIAALKRDRELLIGEAATYEAAGASIVLDKKLWADAREAQEQRRVTDPWEDILANLPDDVVRKTGDGYERVASAELLERVLSIPKAQQTSTHGIRLSLAMKHIGWERNKTGLVKIDGTSARGYIRQATEGESKPESYTERGLAQFINFYTGSDYAIYTDCYKGEGGGEIALLHQPLPGRPVYIHVVRDERRILISRKALDDYLRKERIQADQVVEGLSKFFNAKKVRLTLGAGTAWVRAQEDVIELPVPPGSQLLEGVLCAHGGKRVKM